MSALCRCLHHSWLTDFLASGNIICWWYPARPLLEITLRCKEMPLARYAFPRSAGGQWHTIWPYLCLEKLKVILNPKAPLRVGLVSLAASLCLVLPFSCVCRHISCEHIPINTLNATLHTTLHLRFCFQGTQSKTLVQIQCLWLWLMFKENTNLVFVDVKFYMSILCDYFNYYLTSWSIIFEQSSLKSFNYKWYFTCISSLLSKL